MRRGKNHAGTKLIKTTLGELIVAVTDEVMPIIRDPSRLYLVVSYILADLLAHRQVRPRNRPRRGMFSRGRARGVMPYSSL
jgi:hypothetical protein